MENADAALRETPDWHARPLILSAIGLLAGLLVHLILGSGYGSNLSTFDAAALTGVTLAAGLAGFTLERRRWLWSVAFALALALVGALVVAWNGAPKDADGWRMVSLLLAVAIAAPLFQAARDEGARRFPYDTVHDHAWTNVVLWCACWVFVGIVFALAWLLATLFDLIKIDFLRELLEEDWFWRALIGLAFGAGLGLLREHDGVVRLLQRVVATVLAVLAPVLAVGLVLFVLALPFTGLGALWEATKSTTPILLSCVIGALILANAVIGNAPEEERRFPLLRYGAMGLAAVILPLALLAAVATGLRIGQYGFTPERLWAMVFVALACAYGGAYLFALVAGRLDWSARIRPLNLALAFVVCGVALVLATPLVSFNAISTRDQVARLDSGKVTPEQFDWRALRFDFGAPGAAALKRLQASANPAVRAKAVEAAKAESRWEIKQDARADTHRREVAANMRVLPRGAAMPDALRNKLAESGLCTGKAACTLLMTGPSEALLLRETCFPKPKPGEDLSRFYVCGDADRYVLEGADWKPYHQVGRKPVDTSALHAGYASGTVEVRTVPRRQLFVGGVPVGESFE